MEGLLNALGREQEDLYKHVKGSAPYSGIIEVEA